MLAPLLLLVSSLCSSQEPSGKFKERLTDMVERLNSGDDASLLTADIWNVGSGYAITDTLKVHHPYRQLVNTLRWGFNKDNNKEIFWSSKTFIDSITACTENLSSKDEISEKYVKAFDLFVRMLPHSPAFVTSEMLKNPYGPVPKIFKCSKEEYTSMAKALKDFSSGYEINRFNCDKLMLYFEEAALEQVSTPEGREAAIAAGYSEEQINKGIQLAHSEPNPETKTPKDARTGSGKKGSVFAGIAISISSIFASFLLARYMFGTSKGTSVAAPATVAPNAA